MDRDQVHEDARRFQDWQLAALDRHPPGTELLSFGPFRAVLPPAGQSGAWVTLVADTPTERETQEAIANLRSAFAERRAELEIEYDEAVFPAIRPWLERAGFALAERNPLMGCRADRFRPFAAPRVIVRRLTTESEPDLLGFQTIRWTNGGDDDREVPAIEQLRKDLASPASVYLLAWLDGEQAGTGVSHSLNGAAEIVGVVTRMDKRRQGVAATVTSELVARHFAGGGDFAFLDAANEVALRVYHRLGFRLFGANLVYRVRNSEP